MLCCAPEPHDHAEWTVLAPCAATCSDVPEGPASSPRPVQSPRTAHGCSGLPPVEFGSSTFPLAASHEVMSVAPRQQLLTLEAAQPDRQAAGDGGSGLRANPEKPGAALRDGPRGVVLGFEQGTVSITKRPVQLGFNTDAMPAEVNMAGGHAAELGIQMGWKLKSLDGQDVDPDINAFFVTFVERLNALDGPLQLPLLFRIPTGETQAIVALSSPLGMEICMGFPVTVDRISGLALQLGIEPGWELLRYGETPVSSFETFSDFFRDFRKAVARLPGTRVATA